MSNDVELKLDDDLPRRLEGHPIYSEIRNLRCLRIFMEHHVYAVWDFMSLLKQVQAHIAPTAVPWLPTRRAPELRQFINAMVLAEESDEGLPGGPSAVAHFDLYCQAMREIGADTGPVLRFLEQVRAGGVAQAMKATVIPEAARRFMATTFGFIATDKVHIVAAALAVGREQVIPGMFRALLKGLGVNEREAPAFHHYLRRHIDLDGSAHGPMALGLLQALCAGDPHKALQTARAARKALAARLQFWDEVRVALRGRARPAAGAPQPSPDALGP